MLDYDTLVKYIILNNSDCSVDDLRMGLIKEASADKYEIKNTNDTLDKYGQKVFENVSKDGLYYYSMIDKLRKPKFFGMAIFDITATIIGILFIVAWTNQSFAMVGISVFIFAIMVHWYMGIDTQLGYYVGLNTQMRSMW